MKPEQIEKKLEIEKTEKKLKFKKLHETSLKPGEKKRHFMKPEEMVRKDNLVTLASAVPR